MAGWLAGVGQAAASTAAQGAVGMGLQRLGAGYDRRQLLKTQDKLMRLQMSGERQMMDYQQQKQMEMWENTNYSAQMEQLKKAGLNPALLYGHSGGGGATTGSGGSPGVTGGQAPYVDTAGMGIQLAMQMQMQKAQIENIKADTKQKEATTGKTNIDAEISELQRKLKEKTFAWDVEKGFEEWMLVAGQQRKAVIEANIAEDTEEVAKDLKTQELTKMGVEIAMTNANRNKAEADVAKINNDIAMRIQELQISQNELEIKKQLAEWETSYGKQIAGLLGNVISIIPGLKNTNKRK